MYYKRKIKKKIFIIIIIILILIFLGIGGFSLYKHYTSYEYKLSKIGYNENEINQLLKMDDKVLNKALSNKYNNNLIPLTKEKYFLWKNYSDYLAYIKKVKETSLEIDYKEIVVKVNTKTNNSFYTNTKATDMDMEYAILVNKYYHLPPKYSPDDIVNVSNWYAYEGISIRSEVYEAFKSMFNAAKKDKIYLIANSGYRTYENQKKLYDQYKDTKGEEYADGYVARPDYSEHQTGLALDIVSPGVMGKDFENTDAFKWLEKYASDYGFILRYPKNKENITGYHYESWHYRYLGKNLAKKVKKSGLTYEEYYAYYLEKK